MTSGKRPKLVLAIYFQTTGFGFVLLEQWSSPVDWGTPELQGRDRATRCLKHISRSRQFDGCEIEIIDGLPDWSSRTSVETAGTGTGNPRRSPW